MGNIKGNLVREVRNFLNTPVPQTIITSNVSAASTNAMGCHEVVLQSTTAAFFVFGVAPVATSANHFIPAGAVWPVVVNPGDKIAVISPGGAGVFYISAIS